MNNPIKTAAFAACLAGFGLGLSGCAIPQTHLNPSFGQEVNQDLAAQITDPEAGSRRTAPPLANGNRVGLAMERYRTGTTIVPVTPSKTSSTAGASTSQ